MPMALGPCPATIPHKQGPRSPCPAQPPVAQYTDRRRAARARPWPLVCAARLVVGRLRLAGRLRRPSVRSFVCRRGRTPGDVVVRHITFLSSTFLSTTSTSFLVISGLTSRLTNHTLPVARPHSSHPIHQQHTAFHSSCACPSCFSLTNTPTSPPATAINETSVICEDLSDHGFHNAEPQEFHKTWQECSRP